jgi:uncharacterized protein (DUF885 family)
VPADEIHAVGLEQVANIRKEIQVTMDEHFGGGDVSEFLRRVNEDPAFTFESEDAVLKYSADALDAVKAAMPRAFGTLPKADVLVKPYPEFAASGSGEYHSSSEDGTRPRHLLYRRHRPRWSLQIESACDATSRNLSRAPLAGCNCVGTG